MFILCFLSYIFKILFIYFYQGFAQVAPVEPILQSEEHWAGHTEDEGPAGVFRKVSSSVAKAVTALKNKNIICLQIQVKWVIGLLTSLHKFSLAFSKRPCCYRTVGSICSSNRSSASPRWRGVLGGGPGTPWPKLFSVAAELTSEAWRTRERPPATPTVKGTSCLQDGVLWFVIATAESPLTVVVVAAAALRHQVWGSVRKLWSRAPLCHSWSPPASRPDNAAPAEFSRPPALLFWCIDLVDASTNHLTA